MRGREGRVRSANARAQKGIYVRRPGKGKPYRGQSTGAVLCEVEAGLAVVNRTVCLPVGWGWTGLIGVL